MCQTVLAHDTENMKGISLQVKEVGEFHEPEGDPEESCNENELLTCKVLVYAITSGEIVKLIARVVTSE